ncbi:hypothetical protein BDW59DRAFT_150768 [Aspergillus cavernicola]|uniref:Uncharacterized protein n=1 Tax=Aspergillus cavernicola TaxID=176166 RepID=A0ABR4HYB6_9EURO
MIHCKPGCWRLSSPSTSQQRGGEIVFCPELLGPIKLRTKLAHVNCEARNIALE